MVTERLMAIMGDVWTDRQHREGMIGRRDQPLQDTLREMYVGLYSHIRTPPCGSFEAVRLHEFTEMRWGCD